MPTSTAPAEVTYDATYHKKIELEETPQAERLGLYIANVFKPARATDFGCSTGIYVRSLLANGVQAQGVESSPEAVANAVTPHVTLGDITSHCEIKWMCDLVLCIEVAEHIPGEKADDLIRCLVRHTRHWLVFSAAIPGQGGHGHINCQNKRYWIDKFERRGWIVDYVETASLLRSMAAGYVMGWFIQNAMVLRPVHRA